MAVKTAETNDLAQPESEDLLSRAGDQLALPTGLTLPVHLSRVVDCGVNHCVVCCSKNVMRRDKLTGD
ncbi:MAG: hypothetical protein OXH52_13705 [Gammaproteobacteria bacterium]|nr:hypothetical protein [Gammaproteobacteria bacterium]